MVATAAVIDGTLASTDVVSQAACKIDALDKLIAAALADQAKPQAACLNIPAFLARYFDTDEVAAFPLTRKKDLLRFFASYNCSLTDNVWMDIKSERYFVALLANIPDAEQKDFLDFLTNQGILPYMLETVDTRWIVSGGEDNFAKAIAYLSRYAANQWNQGFDNQATALNFDPANNLFAAKAILFDYNRGRQQFVYDYGHSALLLALYGNNATYFGPYDPLLVNFSNSYSYNGVSFQGIRLLPALFFYAIANDYVNKLNLGTASLSLDAVSLLSGTTLLKQMATRTGKDVLQNPRFWRAVTGVTLSAANIAVNTLLADKLAASTEGKTILEYWNTINLLYGISDIGFNLAQYQQARQAAKARLSKESSDLNNNFDSVADEFEKRIGGSGADLVQTFLNDAFTVEKRAEVISQNLPAQFPTLTIDELTAIKVYTSDQIRSGNKIYQTLNNELRSGSLSPYNKGLNSLVNSGLSKLTPYNGSIVFRGCGQAESQIAKNWKVGDNITFQDFKSSSTDETIAINFMNSGSGDVIYEISNPKGYNICNISCLPGEAEILFKSGTNFKVVELTYLPRFDPSDPLIRVVKLTFVQ